MGSTLQVIATSRTPESVVLRIDNNGTPDDPIPTISETAFLAELLPGPLHEFLARTADWSTLNIFSSSVANKAIRFTMISGGFSEPIIPPNLVCALQFVKPVTGNALQFSINHSPSDGPVPSVILVELRAEHSSER